MATTTQTYDENLNKIYPKVILDSICDVKGSDDTGTRVIIDGMECLDSDVANTYTSIIAGDKNVTIKNDGTLESNATELKDDVLVKISTPNINLSDNTLSISGESLNIYETTNIKDDSGNNLQVITSENGESSLTDTVDELTVISENVLVDSSNIKLESSVIDIDASTLTISADTCIGNWIHVEEDDVQIGHTCYDGKMYGINVNNDVTISIDASANLFNVSASKGKISTSTLDINSGTTNVEGLFYVNGGHNKAYIDVINNDIVLGSDDDDYIDINESTESISLCSNEEVGIHTQILDEKSIAEIKLPSISNITENYNVLGTAKQRNASEALPYLFNLRLRKDGQLGYLTACTYTEKPYDYFANETDVEYRLLLLRRKHRGQHRGTSWAIPAIPYLHQELGKPCQFELDYEEREPWPKDYVETKLNIKQKTSADDHAVDVGCVEIDDITVLGGIPDKCFYAFYKDGSGNTKCATVSDSSLGGHTLIGRLFAVPPLFNKSSILRDKFDLYCTFPKNINVRGKVKFNKHKSNSYILGCAIYRIDKKDHSYKRVSNIVSFKMFPYTSASLPYYVDPNDKYPFMMNNYYITFGGYITSINEY